MQLELEVFTPSEAETITGVSQATVRNWRRAGYLPRHQGHARYDFRDVAGLFVMRILVARGINVKTAKEFAGQTVASILQSAAWSGKAFSACAYAAAKDEHGETRNSRAEIASDYEVEPEVVSEALSMDLLIRHSEQQFGFSGVRKPGWLVIWADDGIEFLYDDAEDAFFGNIDFTKAYVQGPIIIFSLDALAQMVMDRLPRPAIRLTGEE